MPYRPLDPCPGARNHVELAGQGSNGSAIRKHYRSTLTNLTSAFMNCRLAGTITLTCVASVEHKENRCANRVVHLSPKRLRQRQHDDEGLQPTLFDSMEPSSLQLKALRVMTET